MSEADADTEATEARESRSFDQRRHQRMPVTLLGRYMLSDRHEYPCQTIDMSPGGIRITCAKLGEIGERVVLYLEQIGRVEGAIARHAPGGQAIQLNATPRKRDKIASQLTWLANRDSLGLPEGRTSERLVPNNPGVILKLDGGKEVAARILDISMSGVALATAVVIPVGTSIVVGSTPAKVVRQLESGLGARFLLPISPDDFHEGIRL